MGTAAHQDDGVIEPSIPPGNSRNLRLPPALAEELRVCAFEERRAQAQVVRDALRLYFDARKVRAEQA
jgi:hypothetical protein